MSLFKHWMLCIVDFWYAWPGFPIPHSQQITATSPVVTKSTMMGQWGIHHWMRPLRPLWTDTFWWFFDHLDCPNLGWFGTIFPEGQRPYEACWIYVWWQYILLLLVISPLISQFGTAFGLKPLVSPQYAQLAAHYSSNRRHGANMEYQYQWPCKIRPCNGILMGVRWS